MPRQRKPVKELERLVLTGQKRYVRYQEGAELYSMGLHGFQDLAKEADAVRKVKGVALVNVSILNDYIESMYS